jgi:hypothetical protein
VRLDGAFIADMVMDIWMMSELMLLFFMDFINQHDFIIEMCRIVQKRMDRQYILPINIIEDSHRLCQPLTLHLETLPYLAHMCNDDSEESHRERKKMATEAEGGCDEDLEWGGQSKLRRSGRKTRRSEIM